MALGAWLEVGATLRGLGPVSSGLKGTLGQRPHSAGGTGVGGGGIISLIPGVSRAGITMTAARILKFNRVDSSKISFLLSIPALSGASFLGLKDLFDQSVEFNYLVIIAIVSSFIFSFITVKFFLEYINKFSMNVFVIYRIIIALLLFFVIYF